MAENQPFNGRSFLLGQLRQSLPDPFPDDFRISLSAGEFHDLASKKTGSRFDFLRIRTSVLDGLWILGEYLVHPRLCGGGVLNLEEAKLLGKLQGCRHRWVRAG